MRQASGESDAPQAESVKANDVLEQLSAEHPELSDTQLEVLRPFIENLERARILALRQSNSTVVGEIEKQEERLVSQVLQN